MKREIEVTRHLVRELTEYPSITQGQEKKRFQRYMKQNPYITVVAIILKLLVSQSLTTLKSYKDRTGLLWVISIFTILENKAEKY